MKKTIIQVKYIPEIDIIKINVISMPKFDNNTIIAKIDGVTYIYDYSGFIFCNCDSTAMKHVYISEGAQYILKMKDRDNAMKIVEQLQNFVKYMNTLKTESWLLE